MINIEEWDGINLIVPNRYQTSEGGINVKGMTLGNWRFWDVSYAIEPGQKDQKPGEVSMKNLWLKLFFWHLNSV